MEPQYLYSTLPNGMRVVIAHRPEAEVDHCGVAVNAGSRDEEPWQYGLAHFVEHTIFKGTGRRRSWHILNRMEAVGGELNAYTTKEETMLYTTFPSGNLARALDLVADLVTDSRFPAPELAKERGVVEDEIDTYLDIPSEGIYDDFDELIFRGSQLAHPILGTREPIADFDTEACRGWLDRFYVPANMVLFYSGSMSPERFLKMAERCFVPLTRTAERNSRIAPKQLPPFDETKRIDSHQAHNLLGCTIPGLHSEDRYAIALLTNILGGPGMNSLLNVALREKRGLVYSVDASTALMTDCGLLTVYYGCDPEDAGRCTRLILNTIDGMAQRRLTPRQLEAAKRQYLGQMTIGSVNSEQMALGMARSTLLMGCVRPRAEINEAIRAVTADRIMEIASGLRMSRLTLL